MTARSHLLRDTTPRPRRAARSQRPCPREHASPSPLLARASSLRSAHRPLRPRSPPTPSSPATAPSPSSSFAPTSRPQPPPPTPPPPLHPPRPVVPLPPLPPPDLA